MRGNKAVQRRKDASPGVSVFHNASHAGVSADTPLRSVVEGVSAENSSTDAQYRA
jgi:hypothetical protein